VKNVAPGAPVRLQRADREAPFGRVILVAGPDGLCSVAFGPHWAADRRALAGRFGAIVWETGGAAEEAAAAFDAYLAGNWETLATLRVDAGGTPFQRAVWEELRRIPTGGTISYAELARRLGRPAAVRAVGAANGRNPVAVVIPCHRVIGADGSLTGYGGGLPITRWLLEHEARAPGAAARPAHAKPAAAGPRLPFAG
jgi:methylated-DNA-[protein]-cysteine S-methyltransferase